MATLGELLQQLNYSRFNPLRRARGQAAEGALGPNVPAVPNTVMDQVYGQGNYVPIGPNYSPVVAGPVRPAQPATPAQPASPAQTYGPARPIAAPTSSYSAPTTSSLALSEPISTDTSTTTVTEPLPLEPDIRIIGGVEYNINDPVQREAYIAKRMQIAEGEVSGQLSQLQTAYKTMGEREAEDLALALSGINQDLSNLGVQEEEYGRGVVGTIKGLGEGYDTGTVRRSSKFTQLSPSAFQSSQATGQQFAKEKLGEAIDEVGRAKALTEERFRQSRGSLEGETSALQTSFERANEDRRLALEQAAAAGQTYVNQYSDALLEQAAPLDISQNLSPTRYARSAYAAPSAITADVSSYQPYLTFNDVAGLPQATSLQTFTSPTVSSGTSLEQFLGYTPTAEEEDYLQKYLTAGA